MGKLKVIKTGPMASIQDFGRFGYRRYGIPQSGAMDRACMIAANYLVSNPETNPVIEFALAGMELVAEEETTVAIVGANALVNNLEVSATSLSLKIGDHLKILKPTFNYGYLAMEGLLQAQKDFDSYSTYVRAGFGGVNGGALMGGDDLRTARAGNTNMSTDKKEIEERIPEAFTHIRIMKGPEWDVLKELPSMKTFSINPASDRMGIRLDGSGLDVNFREVISSAVIPGIIQLPPDGCPIVLMNDCQTTGGYPRIGKVIDEDMGKLAQLLPGTKLSFQLS